MSVRGLRRQVGIDEGRRGMREVSWITVAPVQVQIMVHGLGLQQPAGTD